MVNLWPWKGKDDSPASFEKTLSTLSQKITETQARLDRTRSNFRRAKLMLALYMTFGYLVFAMIMLFVVGYENLGVWEWSGLAGGPLAIYVVRLVLNTWFNMRIESLETRLKDQQAERVATIQKLKDATKYDTTLELLEKYGDEKRPKRQGTFGEEDGAAPEGQDQASREKQKKGGRHSLPHTNSSGRTNMAPPPTANIQRPRSAGAEAPSQPPPYPAQHAQTMPTQGQWQEQPTGDFAPNAEFAPNAGPLPGSYSQNDVSGGQSRWFDRVLDMMLGEDETASKNRIVLICKNCKLVNGQAPPGTRSLADLGNWKCMGCGTMNGEMDEGKKIVQEVLGQRATGSDAAITEQKQLRQRIKPESIAEQKDSEEVDE